MNIEYNDLAKIQKAAQRSANLTSQLLAFALKQAVSPKVLDLNHIIANILRMLRRLIGEDIEMVWRPGSDLWPIKIDPAQIDQILVNLCVNARDAISDGGKIIIETLNVEIDEAYCDKHAGCKPGNYAMLALSDDGCGMDSQMLDNLFEPFFTTNEFGKGTGLGLATVYGIIKQNEGYINVYSEPGQGTSFKIYLPKSLEDLPAQPLKPDVTIEKGTETILLVEDETAIRQLTGTVIGQCGYTVITASSPAEALATTEKGSSPIDLLITDVVMPGMNGKQLKEQIENTYRISKHCSCPAIRRRPWPTAESLPKMSIFCKSLLPRAPSPAKFAMFLTRHSGSSRQDEHDLNSANDRNTVFS